MKKLLLFTAITLITAQACFSITEEDKAAIRANIDETYSYVYYNPAIEARDRATQYVNSRYFDKYIKCRNNCEIEMDKIRAKANYFSLFTDPEQIQKEANDTFKRCMVENCNHIKEVEMKEYYDYIDKYINSKKR